MGKRSVYDKIVIENLEKRKGVIKKIYMNIHL